MQFLKEPDLLEHAEPPGATSAVRVALDGFPDRAEAALQFLAETRGVGRVCLVDKGAAADVTLFDLDSVGAADRLTAARSEPASGLFVAVGGSQHTVEACGWVPTPIVFADLLDCIEGLVAVAPQPVVAPAPTDTTDTRESAFAPEPQRSGRWGSSRSTGAGNSQAARAAGSVRSRVSIGVLETLAPSSACRNLDGLLQLAGDAVTEVAGGHAPILLVHQAGAIAVGAVDGYVTTSMTDRQLRTLTRSSQASAWESKRLPRGGGPDGRLLSFEELLWAIGVWALGPELPTGVSADDPVRLWRWPNLTRVLPLPHDAALSAVWSSRPLTIAEAADTAAIDRRDATQFFVAAHTARLFDPSPVTGVDSSRKAPTSSESSRRRAPFLSAVLKRLRG